MYDSFSNTSTQALLETRLAAVIDAARDLKLTTREEALEAIYSRINRVLALGNRVSPLIPVPIEGPALAGDVDDNLALLNADVLGIVRQLQTTENDAAAVFNLMASTQNNLRQLVRERIFASTQRLFREEFIHSRNLASQSATIDFNAGMAALPMTSESAVVPAQILIGVSSLGAAAEGTNTANLLDGLTETSYLWNGSKLELVFDFGSAKILNRFRVEMVGYQGLAVEEFSSSPDGILREDLLADLPGEYRSMDGNASKYSGDWVAHFDPRHVLQLRLIIVDRAGSAAIELRNVNASLRRYASSGTLQTVRLTAPAGPMVFAAEQHTADTLTSITHQVSQDGVNFSGITPGQTFDASAGYIYRAAIERLDSNFEQQTSPIDRSGEDIPGASNYEIGSISTVDLGGGIIERSIVLNTVSGVVDLKETPLDNTLVLYNGSVVLSYTAYQVSGASITFIGDWTGLTIRYQTSSYALAGLVARRDYYSPYLHEVRFEQV